MSDLLAQLPLEAVQRIDAACDAFETDWRAGHAPRIEDVLAGAGAGAGTDGTLRAALLQALLKVELELVRSSGGQPRREEYLARFADDVETVRAVLDEAETASPLAPADVAANVAATGEFVGRRVGFNPRTPDDRTRSGETQATVGEQIETSSGQPCPEDSAAAGPAAMPETFGRYRVVRALGQGAMGAVYLAHDTQLDRQVALKIPKFPEGAGGEVLERFYREARSAALLRHAHICPVYDVGEIDGRHCIAMAYIEGQSLKDVVGGRPLPQRTAAEWVRKLALALAEAHRRQIIHRDLKPANIMIDTRGEPVVMDFGLARRVTSDDDRVTHTGHILGTPAYMSPEQVEGDPQRIGPPADIYSLGVILYELLTGQLPFQGTLMAILQQIAIQAPPPPSSLRPDVDPRLEAICRKMMAKRVEERFGSMDAVAQALAEVLEARGNEPTVDVGTGMAVAIDTGRRAGSVAVGRRAGGVSPRVRDAGKRRRKWAVAAALGGALAIVFGVILYAQLGKVLVRIELLDPTLKVRVDHEDSLVIEGQGAPIRLRPGEHRLIVERDGLVTETKAFTVTRGEDIVLRVAVVDEKVIVLRPGDPLPQVAADARTDRPTQAPPPAIAPFDAAQAKEHQRAWAEYLGVPVEYENSIGMKFVLIPPGEFLMGSMPEEIEALVERLESQNFPAESVKSEVPRHKVVLTQPFYLGATEVTQQAYKTVTGKNPSYFALTGTDREIVEKVADRDSSNHPVEGVNWFDAVEFCATLSAREQLLPIYSRAEITVTFLAGNGYRLPTEAEWEFACRAGTTTRYWGGDELSLAQTGWYERNSNRTHAVGELRANPFGLFDVYGNVAEWCQDLWGSTYFQTFADQPAIDPQGPTAPDPTGIAEAEASNLSYFLRPCRGGDWNRSAVCCSSPDRPGHGARHDGRGRIGFRMALSVDGVRQALGLPAFVRPAPAMPVAYEWPADVPAPAIAPFDAAQARAHQESWAAHLGVPVEWENSIGMKFALIPPGEFLMGSTPAEIEAALLVAGENKNWQEFIESEVPKHKVILTQPVYLGIYEVTQAEYEQVMGQNPSHFAATGSGKDAVLGLDTSTHPVEFVTWNDAAEFCAKLSEKEKFKPFYFRSGETVTMLEGIGYRLPTEAQWEFACRAGTTTKYWTGDQDEALVQTAWFGSNSGYRTHAVGELKANPFGLFDMHGNTWEWVQDGWEPTYYGLFQEKPAVDPSGPASAGSRRVNRGGYWSLAASGCRASSRDAYAPARLAGIGFRVALSVEAVKRADENAAQPVASSVPDQVVDLLKLVDVDRDAVHGKWTLTDDGLSSDGGVAYCRLRLPYAPPPEYDFRIEFTAQGGNDILQLLTAGGRSFTWLMGAWGGKYDGFDTVRGHPLTRDGTNIIGRTSAIRRGQRHTSVVQVRRDTIAATIDGELVLRYPTDGADLGIPPAWSIGEGAIGLGTTFDAVLFHKVEIVVHAPDAAGGAEADQVGREQAAADERTADDAPPEKTE